MQITNRRGFGWLMRQLVYPEMRCLTSHMQPPPPPAPPPPPKIPPIEDVMRRLVKHRMVGGKPVWRPYVFPKDRPKRWVHYPQYHYSWFGPARCNRSKGIDRWDFLSEKDLIKWPRKGMMRREWYVPFLVDLWVAHHFNSFWLSNNFVRIVGIRTNPYWLNAKLVQTMHRDVPALKEYLKMEHDIDIKSVIQHQVKLRERTYEKAEQCDPEKSAALYGVSHQANSRLGDWVFAMEKKEQEQTGFEETKNKLFEIIEKAGKKDETTDAGTT